MKIRTKRWLSFSVIHLFMFISGVEYAVVFPTLWEFLQSLGVPPSSSYMLGLAISSLTLTDMLSGLCMGRLMDLKLLAVKSSISLLNVGQICGAVLYLLAVSPGMLVASRLVSGIGKSITIIFLANICQATDQQERTPILLLFNIAFQVGLLLGPAFNLVLSQIHYATYFGLLSNLNSPGLLMSILWLTFSLGVAFCYHDLVALKEKEAIERELASAYSNESGCDRWRLRDIDNSVPDIEVLNETEESQEEYNSVSDEEDSGVENEENPSVIFTPVDSTYASRLPSRPLNCTNTSLLGSPRSFKSRVEDIHLISSRDTMVKYGSISPSWRYDRNPLMVVARPRSTSKSSRIANKFINEAEKLMGERSEDEESEGTGSRSERTSLMSSKAPSEDGDENSELNNSTEWSQYRDLLLSEEIVVLNFLRFVGLFCQTSLESSVPPIMQSYFDFGDFANSILYLCAGIELILVFLVLSLASKCGIKDKKLLLVGVCLMTVALTYLVFLFQNLQFHDRSKFPLFSLGVFLDLAGIPTVCDIGMALYSKIVPHHLQGFGQASRRFISQLALILGPLWAGGTLAQPLLMLGVPLALTLLASCLFLFSYNKMEPRIVDDL